jgi:hypothetical protein
MSAHIKVMVIKLEERRSVDAIFALTRGHCRELSLQVEHYELGLNLGCKRRKLYLMRCTQTASNKVSGLWAQETSDQWVGLDIA